MKALKLKSLNELKTIANPETMTPDNWKLFLKEKGHTGTTFDYLPEGLKLSLKFSFAKKYRS